MNTDAARNLVDNLTQLKRQMCKVARRAYWLGLQRSWEGNLSARTAKRNTFVIKASGLSFQACTPQQLLEIDSTGKVLSGKGVPSKETQLHLAVYLNRPDVGGIVHLHAPWATVAGLNWSELPLLTEHARYILKTVPVIERLPPGSIVLAEAVRQAFLDLAVMAVLLRGHGLVAVGRDVEQAEQVAELVEETSQVAVLHRIINPAGDLASVEP